MRLTPLELNSEQLSWLCVEPILIKVRGKDESTKAEAYNRLNDGQKAMFMFYAFHNHTKSLAEFYWFASYFIGDLKGWPAVKKGVLFFQDDNLFQICNEIEQLLESAKRQPDGTWREAKTSDLEHDPQLLAMITALYEKYALTAQPFIEQMNNHVRNHIEEYLILSEQYSRKGEDSMDVRFPIGRFSYEGEITKLQREAWINEIEQLPRKLRESIEGLEETELNTPYRDGGWTIRQVVHHIADSHMNSFIRFKLALTEETPSIKPYFEDRWANLQDSAAAEVDLSLLLIDTLHKRWVILLKSLTDSDFKKQFYHPESKETVSLDYNLGIYAWHGNHHVAHITAFRSKTKT